MLTRSLLIVAVLGGSACEAGLIRQSAGADAGDRVGRSDANVDTGDAGVALDAAVSAPDALPPPPDAEPGALLLASEDGWFYECEAGVPNYERRVGTVGETYAWITIEYDMLAAAWREDAFDRPILLHVLMGFRRDVPDFVGRYILGHSAEIEPDKPGLDRMSIFHGRRNLDTYPAGMGYMGYIGFRGSHPWQIGETYHVRVLLDAVAKRQRIELSVGGEVVHTKVGDIDYYEPALSQSGFFVDFGGNESDAGGREVRPYGWRFGNLRIYAETL